MLAAVTAAATFCLAVSVAWRAAMPLASGRQLVTDAA
jgi:hypothetical protein